MDVLRESKDKSDNDGSNGGIGGESDSTGIWEKYRSEKSVVVVHERSIETCGTRKGYGIRKLRRAGRYKCNYEVDKRKLMDDVILERLELMKVQREEEEGMEEMKGLKVRATKDDDTGEKEGRRGSEAIDAKEGTDVIDPPEERDGQDEEHVELVVRSRVVKRAKFIMRTTTKKEVRRRRRDRVEMCKFRWHDVIPRRGAVYNSRLPSVGERLIESLRICKIFLTQMQEAWVEVPHIQCVHLKEKGKRMLSVASARLKFVQPDGMAREVCTTCFMVECAH